MFLEDAVWGGGGGLNSLNCGVCACPDEKVFDQKGPLAALLFPRRLCSDARSWECPEPGHDWSPSAERSPRGVGRPGARAESQLPTPVAPKRKLRSKAPNSLSRLFSLRRSKCSFMRASVHPISLCPQHSASDEKEIPCRVGKSKQ